MDIILTGFMGTGKTSVGQCVADLLRLPFYDVDQQIELKSGRTVAEIFQQQGEEVFRKMEIAAIAALPVGRRMVISTGGGALLNPQNRALLDRRGPLICLTATSTTLASRLKGDRSRPLLAGNISEEKMQKLMTERQAFYALCSVRIETDGKSIRQVADEVIRQSGGAEVPHVSG